MEIPQNGVWPAEFRSFDHLEFDTEMTESNASTLNSLTRVAAIILTRLCALLAASLFIYTVVFTSSALLAEYSPVPVWDYWRTAQYLNDLLHLNARHFWIQHNEHRIIFPELVFALDYRFFRGMEVLPIVCSVFCEVVQLGILWVLLKRAKEISPAFRLVLGAAIGVLMLSAFQVQLLLSSFLLQWYMSQLMVALSFLFLWMYWRTKHWGWLAGSIGAAVVATYSSGNGMLIWPLLVVMAIVLGLKRSAAPFLIAGALSIGAFFIGYRVLVPGREKVLLSHPLYAMWFTGVYLGTPASYLNHTFGGLLGLGTLVVVGATLILFIRRKWQNEMVFLAIANCLFIAASALMAAMGRMEPTDPLAGAATAVRYVSTQLVYWAYMLILTGWLIARSRRWRLVGQTITSCILVFALLSVVKEQGKAEKIFAEQQGTIHEAGIALLAGIDDADILGAIFPAPHDLLLMAPALRQNRMSVFRDGRQNWIGQSFRAIFPRVASTTCSGTIDSLVPVAGGYRAEGWVSHSPTVSPLREIVLTNPSGTIIGIGDIRSIGHPVKVSHSLQSSSKTDWVGFVRTDEIPESVQAYATGDHGKTCPLGRAATPPHLKVVEAYRMGNVVGVNTWKADPTWTPDGLPAGFAGGKLLHGGKRYASYSGNDANQGTLTIGPFSVENRNCFVLPVAHGPSVTGQSVRVLDADSGKYLESLPIVGAGSTWRYWYVEVEPSVKRVKIIAEDKGSEWGQWVAVGEPHWCTAAISCLIRIALWCHDQSCEAPPDPKLPGFDIAFDEVNGFGLPGDQPIAGDWTGSGNVRLGVFRDGDWFLDLNGNRRWDGIEGGDGKYNFGAKGDIAVVGDWNGNGVSKLGVFRKGQWFLDTNGNKSFDASDAVLTYGLASDVPVVGNWTHEGRADHIGVYRDGLWIVDSNGNGTYESTDLRFSFGLAGDIPLISHNKSHIGVRRNDILIIDSDGDNLYDQNDLRIFVGSRAGKFFLGEW